MDRRRLLQFGGVAGTGALAGCLGPAGGLVNGSIRPAGGQSVIHRADRHYLNEGYRLGADVTYRAWLLDDAPPREFFAPEIPAEDRRSLLLSLSQTDFEAQFVAFVEARMPVAERYFVTPTVFEDPRWTGLRTAALPVRRSDASDVEDPSIEGADELVCTALIRFEARTTPRSGTVEIYDEDGGQVGRVETERVE
jgi:hypothetical protein